MKNINLIKIEHFQNTLFKWEERVDFSRRYMPFVHVQNILTILLLVVPDVASEAPVGPGVRVDEGSVNNGVVTFDEAEEKGPGWI